MKYPSVEDVLDYEDKTNILEVRRSYVSILSHMFWCALSLVVVLVINISFYRAKEAWGLALFDYMSPRWLALIPLGLFLEIMRKHHDDLYVFGLKRMTHHEGRLSISYNVPSIKYIDIRALVVRQDVIGRIFDYGNIEVGTAAQSNAEVIIEGVRAPKKLAKFIDDLRAYNIDQHLEDEEDEPRRESALEFGE